MNSFERLMNRIHGKPVDRIPNMNIVMQFAAREIGKPYGEIVRNARLMSEAMLRCHEKYGIDCLWTISDSMREPEDLGANVIIPAEGVPYSPEPWIKTPADFSRLHVLEPSQGRAMSDRLETVRLLKTAGRGEAAVIGWVEGAFAAACNLMDVAPFMLLMMDDPDAAQELLQFCYEQELAFALAQVREGAEIIGVGDAAASLIGAAMYEEFAFEYEKKMFEAIHAAGALVKLHICGNINSFLDLAAQTGCDILDCDHMVDLSRASRLMQGRGAVCGNFDPVGIALQGTPEDVRRASLACVELAPENGIVAAGCEIPISTNPENLLATHEALCTLSKH